MEQVISIVVRNQPGVLMRVAGLFSRRGFNIDSLAVGITQNPEFSRMTVTMKADISTVDQVCKQLAKLVEVEAIKVLPPNASTKRSMALVKVKAGDKKLEILKLADVFRGVNDKLHAFVDVMRPYGIIEMVQTGAIALGRGDEALTVEKSRYTWPKVVDEANVRKNCTVI